jgi:hypothetical protein
VVVLDDADRAAIEVYARYVQGAQTIVIENKLGKKELALLLESIDKHLLGVQVMAEEGSHTTVQVFSRDESDLASLSKRLRVLLENLYLQVGLSLEGQLPAAGKAESLVRSGFKLYFLGLRRVYNSDRLAQDEGNQVSLQQLMSYALMLRSFSQLLVALRAVDARIARAKNPLLRQKLDSVFKDAAQISLDCFDAFFEAKPSASGSSFGKVYRRHKEADEQFRAVFSDPSLAGDPRDRLAVWEMARVTISMLDFSDGLMATVSNSREWV